MDARMDELVSQRRLSYCVGYVADNSCANAGISGKPDTEPVAKVEDNHYVSREFEAFSLLFSGAAFP
jgi:hypothetical protein